MNRKDLHLYEIVCAYCHVPYRYVLYDKNKLVFQNNLKPDLYQVKTDSIDGACEGCKPDNIEKHINIQDA